MERIAKKLEGKSLSGTDVLKLVSNKARILTYSDLMKYDNIQDAMGPHKALILLYTTRHNYGHYTAVFEQNKNTIEHFDSYAIFPDEELKWCAKYLKKVHGKVVPHLTWLLYSSPYKNIVYNHHKFQKKLKSVATCGRWVALRIIFKKLPLETFIELFANNAIDSDLLVTIMTMFL